jgi:hypothetical protein
MKIKNRSKATGKWHEQEIPITQEELNRWLEDGTLIQDAFPHLTPQEREFLLSGCTQEEWDKMFPAEEEEEEEEGDLESEYPEYDPEKDL